MFTFPRVISVSWRGDDGGISSDVEVLVRNVVLSQKNHIQPNPKEWMQSGRVAPYSKALKGL